MEMFYSEKGTIRAGHESWKLSNIMTAQKHDVEICVAKVEGPGTFQQNVAQIQNTLRADGWTFIEISRLQNDSPTMFVTGLC
jgi:hypothetical protein